MGFSVSTEIKSNNKINRIESQKKRKILDEIDTNHSAPISERDSEILYNSIVRIDISFKQKKYIGTGFFLKLKLKNKFRYFLITCYHIISESYIIEKLNIKLYCGKYNDEETITIKLDNKERYIKWFDKPVDIILIEILEKDNVKKDKFLKPDLNYKNGYDLYKNDYFYLAGYPRINLNENERSISSGKIIDIIDQSEFEHSLHTGPGNSGSPICLAKTSFVVGIHKGGAIDRSINYGTFLGFILDNLENEDKHLKEINLLKNIKSKSIRKNLFKYINEKIKLKLIKYNIKLKILNNIDIINYKFFSGKYLEYEGNGKGKEYNYDGKLLFEGEYLNGERNGEGKEYEEIFNRLIFEGKYLNGERNGKGKKYGDYGLSFEGEYLNGKRNGKGKEYNNDGNLIFEGEYLSGKRWNGKIYNFKGTLIYDLKMVNGPVKEFDEDNNLIYEGEYLNGKRNGKGKE